MEKFVPYIIFITLLLNTWGCKGKNSSFDTAASNSEVTIIIFDIFRGTIENGLSIIYAKENSLLIIKSNGIHSLGLHEIPPSPIDPNEDPNEANRNILNIKTEVLLLEEPIIKEIERLYANLNDKDLNSYMNYEKIDTGIGIKITIVNSENDNKDITLVNGSTTNQRMFLSYFFNKVIEKSEFNKEKLKLFLN